MRIEDVDELAEVLSSSSLCSVEVEGDGWVISLERPTAGGPCAPAQQAAPPSTARSVFDTPPAAPALTYIQAEVVGIFHEGPTPIVPGQAVKTGEPLGTIDALGIRNDVRASTDGTLTAVQVEDGQPVEYGQVLFAIGHFEEAA